MKKSIIKPVKGRLEMIDAREEVIEVEFTLHELASLYKLLESLDPEQQDEFIQQMLERLNDAAVRLRKRIFGM